MGADQAHYFLALPVPESVQKKLNEVKTLTELQYFKSLTDVQDYHLTLFFLGGVSETQLTRLQERITPIVQRFPTFHIHLDRAAVFGPEKRPRVLFADLKKSDELLNLQSAVTKGCVDVGFKKEKRPFRPHITIAKRWNHKKDFPIQKLANETNDWKHLNWRVTEVVLYTIRLGELPRYQPIARFSLRSE